MKKNLAFVLLVVVLAGCSKLVGPRGESGPAGQNGTNGSNGTINQKVYENVVPADYSNSMWYQIIGMNYETGMGIDFTSTATLVEVYYWDNTIGGWVQLVYNPQASNNRSWKIDEQNKIWLYGIAGKQYRVVIYYS